MKKPKFTNEKINMGAKKSVTIKDHQDDFRTNTKYRLLNPTKNELCGFSIIIKKSINMHIRKKLIVNQWQNTQVVIKWFQHIQNKNLCTFTTFDIKNLLVHHGKSFNNNNFTCPIT